MPLRLLFALYHRRASSPAQDVLRWGGGATLNFGLDGGHQLRRAHHAQVGHLETKDVSVP
jgi:hypothetical protein